MRPLDALGVSLDGMKLVEASAGTGKTHAITTLFVRLLLEKGLSVDRILVVTFTKAATAELRTRIRVRLRDALVAFETGQGDGEILELVKRSRDRHGDRARLREALSRVDEAAVSTIHGFCQRALGENAFESGLAFDLELIADQRALLRELVIDFRARELAYASDARVAHLTARRAGIERWMRLANLAAAMPDLVPVPAVVSEPTDEAPLIEHYLEIRERARTVWQSAGAEIASLVLDDRVMTQSSYRRDRAQKWLDSLDALLASSEPSFDGWFEQMRKFSPAELRAATRRGARAPAHAFFEICEELVVAHDRAASALDEWLLGLEHRLIERARSELGEKKLRAGIQSFDDLLLELLRALGAPRGRVLADRLFERFPAALIDEFQDTDPVQYRIFRHVYRERGSLFLIGDPKQAIYGFRGADIFSYLAAAHDVGGALTLSRNRRTDPALLTAVNTLFSRAAQPFVLEGIDFLPVQPGPDAHDRLTRAGRALAPFEIAFMRYEAGSGREQRERINKGWPVLSSRIAGHIASLLDSKISIEGRRLEPGDIAILTRTNNQAIELQAELRHLGVVSVLLGDKSVFDSPEAGELALILRALSAPNDETAMNAALVTSVFGFSLNELWALREDEAQSEALYTSFSRWHQLWERHGPMRAFRALLRETDAPARVLARPAGERKLTNLLHLSELLHCAATAEHLGIAGLRRWFDEARADPLKRAELAPEAQQLRLESDARAVKLTTMHKSKGLEYPVVICPYLWDGTAFEEPFLQFHDPDDQHRTKLHLQKDRAVDQERDLAERERLAENMRLAYVALTRAKHATSVVWGPFNTCERAPLAYLLHPSEPGSGRDAAQRVHELDGADLLADLARLTRAEPAAFRISEISSETRAPRRSAPGLAVELRARPITRRLDACYRTSSFSALVAASHAVISIPAAEGRDLDENKMGPESELIPSGAVSERVLLHAFPRGAKAGDALHTLLETIDFQSVDAEALAAHGKKALERYGIDASWTELLCEAIGEILGTPLIDAGGFSLRDVARSERLNELEFMLPVRARLGPRALAEAFDDLPAYAERLRRLEFLPLEGHLRGFIDLVFRHDGRFYVVDYKSNYLGARPRDYRHERLAASMAEHDYLLQAHLYSLAVDRYLARRVSGYLYERDFGGVLYLFLRGLHPARGGETGVYFDRPPAARLARISALLGEKVE